MTNDKKDISITTRPWFFYKFGLFVIAGAFVVLFFYLLIFILNPIIYRSFGPEGAQILYDLQNFFLSFSIIIFLIGIIMLITGLVRKENVGKSWLVVIFIAPTFFTMAAIVFSPLIQGISFSFTNADQNNMSKLKPTVAERVIDGKRKRVREMKVVPPTFEYTGFENYVDIFTGKSGKVREEIARQSKQVEELVDRVEVIILPEGNKKVVLTDILFFKSAELFQLDLESKFKETGEMVSFKNLSNAKRVLFEIEILPDEPVDIFLKKAFLPKPETSIFFEVLGRTFIWTFVNVFFHFLIGLGLALLLNRKLKFRAGYRILLLLPWGVPSVVSAFSWRWLFNYEFGLINFVIKTLGGTPANWLSDPTLMMVAVIITNVWLGFPFMMVSILGGLQTIPKELYESARVDGASPFQQFWNITLPLLKPVAMTATLLGIIWTFNMFNVIYLVTQASTEADILVTYAYRAAFMNWDIGISTAYAVIILIVLVGLSSLHMKLLKGEGDL